MVGRGTELLTGSLPICHRLVWRWAFHYASKESTDPELYPLIKCGEALERRHTCDRM